MTRFARLTLLLIVAGAFALAGCGGDDNGGLSAEDQARISAAEDAAAMAQAEAEAAHAEAEAAEAAQAEAEAEIAAAQAAADAAQAAADAAAAAADAAQAEAEAATMAAADAEDSPLPADIVMAVWEATFGPAVEAEFSASLSDNPTTAEIRDAIIALAAQYGVDSPNTLAGLDAQLAAFFGVEAPTAETALSYFRGLRDGGFLPASRARALAISPPADAQAEAISALTEAVKALTDAEAARQAAAAKAVADATAAAEQAAAEQAAEDAEAAATKEIVDIVTAVLEQTGLVQSQADMDAEAAETAEAEAAAEANRQFAAAVTEVLEQAGLVQTQAEKDAAQQEMDEAEEDAQELAGLMAHLASLNIPDDTVNSVYEALAGPAIQAYFEDMLMPSMTRAQVVAAIEATAEHFGLDDEHVSNAVMYAFPQEHVNLREDRVKAAFMAIRDAGLLPATRTAAIVAINDAAPDTVAVVPGEPTEPTEPTEPDITMVAYIDHIIAMDGLEEVTFNEASNDAEDYMSEYIGDPIGDPTKVDDNLYTFAARPSPAFGDVDPKRLSDLYGGWMQYNFFGSLLETEFGKTADADNIRAFSVGMESDRPMGRKNGSAHWNGVFVGHHHANLVADGTAGDGGDNDVISIGDQASGSVDLEVNFDKDGIGTTLSATFEIDKGELTAAPADHVIGSISIGRTGNFKRTVATGDTDASTAVVGSMVDGQFYGPEADEAGGVMKLMAPSGQAYQISGAFGTSD